MKKIKEVLVNVYNLIVILFIWIASIFKKKVVKKEVTVSQADYLDQNHLPYIIYSTNKETLYNVELFRAIENVNLPEYVFSYGFGNMSYRMFLASITAGQVANINAVRITLGEKGVNFDTRIYLKITHTNIDGSGMFKTIPFILNDNQFIQNQCYAECFFELNGLTSVIINELHPNTVFYLYPWWPKINK